MKKHPVDKLFAHKLSNWELEASSDLWKRIETKQNNQSRRLGGWYWYAAAGIAIVMMAGYVVWQSQTSEIIYNNRKVANTEQKSIQDTKRPESGTSQAGQEHLADVTDNSTPQEASYSKSIRNNRELEAKTKAFGSPEKNKVMPTLDDIQIARIEKEEPTSGLMPTEIKEIAAQPTVEIPSVSTAENSAEATKSRVIIARIQTDELVQEDQKSSKFIRILRQLKNAKQGEAVNWDEVGFNPKRLMARADERIRNEEDKLSKQYQNLKEKTKL